MTRRFYHRGHNVELHDKENNLYRIKMGGKILIGTLWGVKQSIDWWCDNRIIRKPDEFEKQEFAKPGIRKIIEKYKGIKILNDDGGKDTWYTLYKGKLLKGSLSALKKYIDSN